MFLKAKFVALIKPPIYLAFKWRGNWVSLSFSAVGVTAFLDLAMHKNHTVDCMAINNRLRDVVFETSQEYFAGR